MPSSARKRSRCVRTARENASVSPVVRPTSRISARRSRKSLASLLQVATLPGRGLARCRSAGGGAWPSRWCVAHMSTNCISSSDARRGDRGDHALPLGQADLDREADAVGRLARVHVGGDPLAVAEAQDRLARLALVAGVGLEVGVVDRAEDDVLDVASRDPAGAVEVRRRVDRKAVAGERARIGLAVARGRRRGGGPRPGGGSA